jgi:hypothetical protein
MERHSACYAKRQLVATLSIFCHSQFLFLTSGSEDFHASLDAVRGKLIGIYTRFESSGPGGGSAEGGGQVMNSDCF